MGYQWAPMLQGKDIYTKLGRPLPKSTQGYHKWSLTICDGCFDTLKSSKMQS